MDKKYDIVIIGGGIAGALLAYKLSKHPDKLSILLLEAGADRTSERLEMSLSYAYSIVKSPRSPYDKNSSKYLSSPDGTKDYYEYTQSSQEFKSTYLKLGGGSTWHWLGNVPRFLPNDFVLHSKYGVGEKHLDWPIGYAEIEKYYCEAEYEIGVSGDHLEWQNLYDAYRSQEFPMPRIWPSYLEEVVKSGIEGMEIDGLKVNLRGTPQARNSQAFQGRPACAGNSSCVPICPIQAKYDATVHLKKAQANGVEVMYESIAFNMEKDSTGLINKVHFKKWDGSEDFVEATVFVLAAHAIESAVLMLASKVGNKNVGKYLMDHPQGYGVGLSNEPIYPFRGPPTTSGIDVFRDGDFRKERAAFRISIGNDGWGRWKLTGNYPPGTDKLEAILIDNMQDNNFLLGEELKKAIEDKVVRLFRFSYSTEMLPDESNRVELGRMPPAEDKSPLPRPKLNFATDTSIQYNLKGFNYAGEVLKKLFLQLGLNETQFEVQNENSKFSGAGHIMGTTRMGDDPNFSVTDKNCRTYDHKNLFIAGPGVFATSGTANPTLTAAALSLRLAETIIKEFETK
jgi:glucose dehydrogenase